MKNNNTLFKTAAALATSVLLVTALTLGVSCRKQDGQPAAQAPKTVDYSQHETFTAWLMADGNEWFDDYSDNPSVWALNKKFNVTLKFEQPVRGTEGDALSLMFGTGEYTDMIWMSSYTGSVKKLYEDGVIVNIADYLDYMPNYKKLLDSNEGFRKASYDNEGNILILTGVGDPGTWEFFHWGGLVYRRDILETITGKNVRFPSGNDYPKTIEDWEYMLPLFKTYFESVGMKDYAPLILPYLGYFPFGELANSFGVLPGNYVDGATVKNGMIEEAFRKYLARMREWYAKGWIYKDFSSRTNDSFYLPNPALTYGAGAGIWYGLRDAQLGDVMSQPQYGLIFDVKALPSPLSTQDGITEFANFARTESYETGVTWAFTSKCKNLPKLFSVIDYLFSEEGGRLFSSGLTKETGSAENPVLIKAGLQDGMYWYEGDTLVVNPALKTLDRFMFIGGRLPGRIYTDTEYPDNLERARSATAIWDPYPNAKLKRVPGSLSYTSEEETLMAANNTRVSDYYDSMIPKFIMGTVALDDATWTDFKKQLGSLGMTENLRLTQKAYDAYMNR